MHGNSSSRVFPQAVNSPFSFSVILGIFAPFMSVQFGLKKHIGLTLLIGLCCWGVSVAQSDDRSGYYTLLASRDVEKIDSGIGKLAADNAIESTAYAGALMMKKAGLIKNPAEKLKEFKTGREKLESAISSAPDNVEFRMLRLMTQEKAPSFLRYNKDIEGDSRLLRERFNTLNAAAQKALIDYSKTSQFLKPSDFQP